MRVFKSSRFSRFARKENIANRELLDIVNKLGEGQPDADLGGDVFKMRLARSGEGKYESELLGSLHETAVGLHKTGVISDNEMQEYDRDCLVSDPKSSSEDKRSPTQNPMPVYVSSK